MKDIEDDLFNLIGGKSSGIFLHQEIYICKNKKFQKIKNLLDFYSKSLYANNSNIILIYTDFNILYNKYNNINIIIL